MGTPGIINFNDAELQIGANMGQIVTNVTSTGWDGLRERINRHKEARSPKRLQEQAYRGAVFARHALIEDMMRPKSGEWYPGNLVLSSAEGQTPAIQSGELVENTDAKRGPLSKDMGTAYLDSTGKHAIWMEFGWTTRDGKVHYRPFHRTIIARNRDKILAEMKK